MSHPESTNQDPNEALDAADTESQDEGTPGVDQYFDTDERVLEIAAKLKAAQTEVLKSHAEAENFRKRLQRDAEQQLRYANMPLLRDLLDVVDNLKRATDSATGESAGSALHNGVQLVTQQLVGILAKYACKPIESVGKPFDPNFHEAITQMPSADIPAGSVVQEVAVGYTLHDRVVRPAAVIVSTGPA